MKSELFSKIIKELRGKTGYLTLYFQGEPYLNPQFTSHINIAHKAGLITETSSNAHFLTEENCKQTIISGLDKIISAS